MIHLRPATFATVLLAIASVAAAGDVRIRVANRTGRDLKAVKVVFHDDKTFLCGDLKNGAVSPYYSRGPTYRYAYGEAYIGRTKIICQPYDFPGKPDVVRGDYSYVLTHEKQLERPYRLCITLSKD